ncbi:MAG: STAS domain-containing protein [Micrococcales bacterium]|nr:STAS domain-containing protein [Micrococcales bacterium]
MTLRHEHQPSVTIVDAPDGHDVTLVGRLDVHTVPDIRDALHEVIRCRPGELRLHLAGAEIGDATGLGMIMSLHRRAAREHRRMLIIDPSDRTARLLRYCRLDRLLTVRHSGLNSGLSSGRPSDTRRAAGTVSTLTA